MARLRTAYDYALKDEELHLGRPIKGVSYTVHHIEGHIIAILFYTAEYGESGLEPWTETRMQVWVDGKRRVGDIL